jgi:hypothetical protein
LLPSAAEIGSEHQRPDRHALRRQRQNVSVLRFAAKLPRLLAAFRKSAVQADGMFTQVFASTLRPPEERRLTPP